MRSLAIMAQDHQEYIQQKVNPILENLVTQLLLERPEQLATFMVKWLSEHAAKSPASAALTEGVNELCELKAELEKLQEEVKALEAEVGDAGFEADDSAAKDDDDEEEEDEDDDEADVEPPPATYMKKPRTSVSAEAYGEWNQKQAWTPPVYPKTDEQKARIQKVVSESFLFSALDKKDIDVLIDAMQEKMVEAQSRLINQGDDGDCLYVVEDGQMDCFKKQSDGEEKLVKECKAGDAFGELALLYNCPRAASVVAREKSVLWRLDRESFNNIVRDAASARRERYEGFLKRVPILETMEAYERTNLCDALHTETYNAGDVILKQGDRGDKFYILEAGECTATKVYVEDTPAQEVRTYASGDYFGELALLRNEPRAANIVAKSDCRLLSLSRKTFKVLLGPLEDILKRNAAAYK